MILDMTAMQFMALCTQITGSIVKDCVRNDTYIVFVVAEGEMGKAIGKGASNLRRLEHTLKKKVKMIEYSSNPVRFIQNIIHPLRVREIKTQDRVMTLVPADIQTRGALIGRNAVALRFNEMILKRHSDIQELKVV